MNFKKLFFLTSLNFLPFQIFSADNVPTLKAKNFTKSFLDHLHGKKTNEPVFKFQGMPYKFNCGLSHSHNRTQNQIDPSTAVADFQAESTEKTADALHETTSIIRYRNPAFSIKDNFDYYTSELAQPQRVRVLPYATAWAYSFFTHPKKDAFLNTIGRGLPLTMESNYNTKVEGITFKKESCHLDSARQHDILRFVPVHDKPYTSGTLINKGFFWDQYETYKGNVETVSVERKVLSESCNKYDIRVSSKATFKAIKKDVHWLNIAGTAAVVGGLAVGAWKWFGKKQ